jgi:hypothetical protein
VEEDTVLLKAGNLVEVEIDLAVLLREDWAAALEDGVMDMREWVVDLEAQAVELEIVVLAVALDGKEQNICLLCCDLKRIES